MPISRRTSTNFVAESKSLLSASNLTKSYGGVRALDSVSLELNTGETVGLLGANGAGKSTLIKILCGLVTPDSGSIIFEGKQVGPLSPKVSEQLGISVIHQERHALENLTVAENIYLGREPRLGPFLDNRSLHANTQVVLDRLRLDVSPATPVQNLSNAQRQMVEIARALSFNAKLVIMDEPTSSLSETEAERLLTIVDELRSQGVTVLYVSHRIDEILRIATRTVSLTDGKNSGNLAGGKMTRENIIQSIIGRTEAARRSESREAGEARLVVSNVRTTKYPDSPVSFEVRRGEVLGITGLVGSGRSEVARVIFGIDRPVSGEVTIDGEPLKLGDTLDTIEKGVFLVPEDRRNLGVILDFSIERNITLPSVKDAGGPIVSEANSRAMATTQIQNLSIKCATMDQPVSSLSGGNQQKVALGKWLAKDARCLVLDEPTCGVDIGARGEIYDQIDAMAKQGLAVLMISSDTDEVLTQCDRVLVFSRGGVAGELSRDQLSKDAIMRLAI